MSLHWDDLDQPLLATVMMLGGAVRLAQAGVTEGTALLAGGLVALGHWLGGRGGEK